MAGADENHSEAIAAFVESVTFSDLPGDAIDLVEASIVDTVGVTLAGMLEEPARIAAKTVTAHGGGGSTSLFGGGTAVPPQDAAFVHGTAGHSLDFDDSSAGTYGHPSVTMVPAMLAMVDDASVTGADLVTAYVAGFETQCYVAEPIRDSHYSAGWHPTATLGTLGTAVAVGKLLDLPARRLRHALNVAASMSAGLKRNFGSMTKSLHAGHAARSGLSAALLARDGLQASDDTLGGTGGYWELFGGGAAESQPGRTLGEDWAITSTGLHLKKYPCCHYTHGAIEATTSLAEATDLHPADVDRIEVVASRGAMDAAGIETPTTGLEGKFSMPFVVAQALVHRTVGLETFESPRFGDSTVRSLLDRVRFEVDESMAYGSLASSVTLVTTDGRSVEATDVRPPGRFGDPLTPAEREAKFEMCAGRVLDDRAVADSWRGLRSIRSSSDVANALAPLR